ncbi:hypothetical protein CFC21_046047 [Triticum aestivum]|uniref:Bifunctional inhibitor/plant lipid transfer protein/seed storage helical domain-containing protein n=2 Tax=Triticum aestivum TaxID=4565 RepID=A0A9R1FUG2_WHEAT|nr:hypothetical protein CFC21_046047 [Triticum aestivum]
MASSKVMWVFCLLALLAFTSCSYHVRAEDHATKEKNEVMEYCKRYIFKNYGDQFPDPHRKCCQTVSSFQIIVRHHLQNTNRKAGLVK